MQAWWMKLQRLMTDTWPVCLLESWVKMNLDYCTSYLQGLTKNKLYSCLYCQWFMSVVSIGENKVSCTLQRSCCLCFESGYCFEDILYTPHSYYMFSTPVNSARVSTSEQFFIKHK
jgi:hypothetical protein